MNDDLLFTFVFGIVAIVILIGVAALYIKRIVTSYNVINKNRYKSFLSVQIKYDKLRYKSNVHCSVLFIKTFGMSKSSNTSIDNYKNTVDTLLEIFNDENDIISGYKNDGFVILTCNSESIIIEKLQMLNNLMRLNRSVSSGFLVHGGSYMIPANDITFEETVARAKLAADKAEIANTLYVSWNYGIQQSHNLVNQIDTSIKKGFDEVNFFLEFQPIIDLISGRIVGSEVLTRFLHEMNSRIVPPSVFLPIISNNDLNESFDFFVFNKCCKWISMNREIVDSIDFISVNFSRVSILSKNFADRVINTIESYNIDFRRIGIEILEDTTNDDFDFSVTSENLKRIREKGIVILYDDFGDGYRCFDDLINLPIDYIKISKNITKNVNTEIGRKIFNSILSLGKSIGASIICEGVEYIEQINFLNENDCRFVQGFYFYRPIPANQFEKLLNNSVE